MNNEEQMRADFEAWWKGRHNGFPVVGGVWDAWQAATASKQREINSLHRANESERGLNDALQRQVNGLNQQVLELSAQVAVLLETLETVADSGICNGAYTLHEECHKAVYGALSLTPPAALEAHDNEVAAKALEGVLLEINATPSLQLSERQREAIRRIVESRSKK